ncbi:tau 95 subunit of transcription factor TFIIIC, partial [Spiromyces aspiralis]
AVATGNLLIKVTRKVRRRRAKGVSSGDDAPCTGIDDQPWRAEVMGVIKKTVRFKSNYQLISDPEDPLLKLMRNINDLKLEPVVEFASNENFNKPQPPEHQFIPMPPMARNTWPFNYNYQQNPQVIKVLVQNNPDE